MLHRTRTILLSAVCLALLSAAPAPAAIDSRGTDFWLAFQQNLDVPELTLFIAGETETSGTVTIPSLTFSEPFTVTPGSVTSVALPPEAMIVNSDTVEDLGVHVTAEAEVTVYGLNRVMFTTDAFLGLPTDALGTDYINLGFVNTDVVNGTEFAVVATQDGTTVTITPSVTTGGHEAGVPYTVTMDQGQTYQLRGARERRGPVRHDRHRGQADRASSAATSARMSPTGEILACDHLVEELPPTTTWGQNFVTMPLATRTGGDTFRILASTDGTVVSINGGTGIPLDRGQMHQQIIVGPSEITSTKPILVMQYSNGTTFDDVTSDPFQMMIPSSEQFLASYTVSTPASGFADQLRQRRGAERGRRGGQARRRRDPRGVVHRDRAERVLRARRSPSNWARTRSPGRSRSRSRRTGSTTPTPTATRAAPTSRRWRPWRRSRSRPRARTSRPARSSASPRRSRTPRTPRSRASASTST